MKNVILDPKQQETLLTSFQPLVNHQTKVLILGSMPGRESLNRQEYYANKNNHFWPLMEELFEIDRTLAYEQKLNSILAQGIGLWDVLASCVREGSLDSNIRQGIANDFEKLFQNYPNIDCVLFNGSKAWEIFRKEIGFSACNGITFRKMPSTSPANTRGYDWKRKEWSFVKDYLEGKCPEETIAASARHGRPGRQ